MKKAISHERFFANMRAMSLLVGTTIGAGILAIPYAISLSGYWLGILYTLCIGFGMIYINLMMAEISLRTKGTVHLPELAQIYLGNNGMLVAFFALFVFIYGSLTAYLAGIGSILAYITGWPMISLIGMVFLVLFIILYLGFRVVSQWEVVFVIALILVVISLLSRAFIDPSFNWEVFRLQATPSLQNIIAPYGIIVFSYLGMVSIPELEKTIGKYTRDLSWIIILSGLIVILLYSVFVTVVLGFSGNEVNSVATTSFIEDLPRSIILLVNGFGILAMVTSFLTLALSMQRSLGESFGIAPQTALIITTFVPIALLLSGIDVFSKIVSWVGIVGGGVLVVLVVLIFWRAKSRGQVIPEFSLGLARWQGITILFCVSLAVVLSFV